MTTIYTDGACLKNPGGPGGWAAIIVTDEGTVELTGDDPDTTNNRMELQAVLAGLQKTAGPVRIVSDSRYVVDGGSVWRLAWKRRAWRTKGKEAVKNQDLWLAIDAAVGTRLVEWEWVRGHNGHPYNERCDVLANGRASLCGIETLDAPFWTRQR